MNKIELLEEMYEMAVHNWICYSKNLTLAEAKKGYEREWEESKEKIELLQEMIEEQKYKENIKLSHVQILKTYPNAISDVEAIKNGNYLTKIDKYFKFFYKETSNLLDYISKNTIVF